MQTTQPQGLHLHGAQHRRPGSDTQTVLFSTGGGMCQALQKMGRCGIKGRNKAVGLVFNREGQFWFSRKKMSTEDIKIKTFVDPTSTSIALSLYLLPFQTYFPKRLTYRFFPLRFDSLLCVFHSSLPTHTSHIPRKLLC